MGMRKIFGSRDSKAYIAASQVGIRSPGSLYGRRLGVFRRRPHRPSPTPGGSSHYPNTPHPSSKTHGRVRHVRRNTLTPSGTRDPSSEVRTKRLAYHPAATPARSLSIVPTSQPEHDYGLLSDYPITLPQCLEWARKYTRKETSGMSMDELQVFQEICMHADDQQGKANRAKALEAAWVAGLERKRVDRERDVLKRSVMSSVPKRCGSGSAWRRRGVSLRQKSDGRRWRNSAVEQRQSWKELGVLRRQTWTSRWDPFAEAEPIVTEGAQVAEGGHCTRASWCPARVVGETGAFSHYEVPAATWCHILVGSAESERDYLRAFYASPMARARLGAYSMIAGSIMVDVADLEISEFQVLSTLLWQKLTPATKANFL
ncbi:hypothetical protein APHAL10511_006591 [Amanita phalloides]|nr:hypothetical protein APHAL10511_006591 [Amanita phalloides]